ncbi:23084_t:CDS:2 [Rhizophagus irregularis]|nr:23084_t:CDS:2 [Rhizophagus irregularis]
MEQIAVFSSPRSATTGGICFVRQSLYYNLPPGSMVSEEADARQWLRTLVQALCRSMVAMARISVVEFCSREAMPPGAGRTTLTGKKCIAWPQNTHTSSAPPCRPRLYGHLETRTGHSACSAWDWGSGRMPRTPCHEPVLPLTPLS